MPRLKCPSDSNCSWQRVPGGWSRMAESTLGKMLYWRTVQTIEWSWSSV